MISDITLGQFFPGTSPIHKLDPRMKIVLSTLFIVTVFLAKNPATLFCLALVTLILIFVSKISFKVIMCSDSTS